MKRCRICYQENILYYLSEIDEERGISILNMISSIADIKILPNDKHNKICLSCKAKALKAYDFKLLVERSFMGLCDINQNKIIKFSNINEVKSKFEFKFEIKSKPMLPIDLMKEIDKEGTCITYKNTIIKKVDNRNNKENKEMAVLDFIQSIKREVNNDDFAYNSDFGDCGLCPDHDNHYTPYKTVKKKKRANGVRKKAHNGYNTTSNVQNIVRNVCIKPVFLKDVRVLYYNPQETQKRKKLYRAHYKKKKTTDICFYCGKLTRSLKSHLLVHIGKKEYKCDICSKAYLSESGLKNHKLSHSDIKNYKCDMCVAAFVRGEQLKNHMKMHSNIISFYCGICNKGFKRKTALTRHVKLHNSVNNKNVKCHLCSMSFYSKAALRHHMRVHTGERPYKCEMCSQPYSYKRDFNRHCLKKHGVFLKRRSVNIMNEDVLQRERALMNELLLRKQGLIKDSINPFEGPQSAMAYEQFMQALETGPIHDNLSSVVH